MKLNGLTTAEVEKRRQKYGSNALTQIPPDPLWKKVLTEHTERMDLKCDRIYGIITHRRSMYTEKIQKMRSELLFFDNVKPLDDSYFK